METPTCPPAEAISHASCIVIYPGDRNFFYIGQQIAQHHDLDIDEVLHFLANLEPNEWHATNSPFGLSVVGLACASALSDEEDMGQTLPLMVTVH